MPAKTRCVSCRKPIRGKPLFMKLQITSDAPKFVERAKKLGFTSATWRVGDHLEGKFHRRCFELAKVVWQVAFQTRAVSPRR